MATLASPPCAFLRAPRRSPAIPTHPSVHLRFQSAAECGLRGRSTRRRAVVRAGLIEKTEQGQVENVEGRSVETVEGRSVELSVTNLGNNTRRVEARIAIEAPLQAVWAVLTDYERLADHIPGLAESTVLELRTNGARLLQIGQKNLALGVKFKARAVVEVTEEDPQDLDDGTLRDISFVTVEGDFQVFKGTWRMHQTCGSANLDTDETWLSYILEVQPKRWMPVALIEGVLGDEITCNLISVRNVALRNHLSLES